ncbi:MAG: response regulator [Magnetococcales bacterium]|nr:response regulator [Magnetococcales bacterium]
MDTQKIGKNEGVVGLKPFRCGATCRLMIGLIGLAMLILLGYGASQLIVGDVSQNPISYLSITLFVTLFGSGVLLYFLFHRPQLREVIENEQILSNSARLNTQMRGTHDPEQLCQAALDFLAPKLHAQIGALYLLNDDERSLTVVAGYGMEPGWIKQADLSIGEGLIGQVARDKTTRMFHDLSADQVLVQAGPLSLHPKSILLAPLVHGELVKGVIMLGSIHGFEDLNQRFLDRAFSSIAIAVAGVRSALRHQELLSQTEKQKNELSNHQQMLQHTIKELEQASRYKSRFLASMSHELRSPLNSLLILSQLLEENREGNLSDKQVEFAQTIHSAGTDLLSLIDEVLDLARIEAGKVRIYLDRVKLSELADSLDRLYRHIALNKGIGFRITLKGELPIHIHSDRQRVEQILKNLLTNAIKFTEQGAVTMDIRPWIPPIERKEQFSAGSRWIAISVKDTGIGIPEAQQKLIFEPFKQVDDTSTRKYGGTGLGLAICQELSILLKGQIELSSREGEGSRFTLYLPWEEMSDEEESQEEQDKKQEDKKKLTDTDVESIRDDRRNMRPHDKGILIVGNDHEQVRHHHEIIQSRGFGVVVAGDLSSALYLTNYFQPIGVVLATALPGVDSKGLIEKLRQAIGGERVLPVFLLSSTSLPAIVGSDIKVVSADAPKEDVTAQIEAFLELAVTNRVSDSKEALTKTVSGISQPKEGPHQLKGRKILIVEDDLRNIFAMTNLLEGEGAEVIMARNGLIGLEKLKEIKDIDIVLLDIMMPDMDGYEVLREMRRDQSLHDMPVLVLTAKAMQGERNRCLKAGASDYLPKPIDPPKLLAMIHTWLNQ